MTLTLSGSANAPSLRTMNLKKWTDGENELALLQVDV